MTDVLDNYDDGFTLGDSNPYLDYDVESVEDVRQDAAPRSVKKTGGDISFKTSDLAKYIIITVLIIIAIYLIAKIFYSLKIQGEDYNQRKAHYYFDNLHGEAFDEDAKQALAYGEAIENPRAIDHYRLGTTYLVAANNPRQAHRHFLRALEQVIGGEVDMKEAPFIIDRIDDYKDYFVNFPDIEELPIQQAMMAQFEQQQTMIKQIERKKAEIKEDDPDFTQKILLSRQDWQSDSQNVHDSAIYAELSKQLLQVRDENARIPNLQSKDYADVANWLKIRYKDDPESDAKIQKVLTFLNNNYPVTGIPNISEQDILTTVWRRAYDPENKEHFNDLRESIGDAVMDCVEGGSVVCMSGRSSKIWQALARLDKDPEVGVLKSKQALRNEIYELSAKVVDDYVGSNGTASDALKEAYRNGENTEQVKELTECMKKQIAELAPKYQGLLPQDQLDLTIQECQASV